MQRLSCQVKAYVVYKAISFVPRQLHLGKCGISSKSSCKMYNVKKKNKLCMSLKGPLGNKNKLLLKFCFPIDFYEVLSCHLCPPPVSFACPTSTVPRKPTAGISFSRKPLDTPEDECVCASVCLSQILFLSHFIMMFSFFV